jgi:diguanylate cyclase (GGDEF)-like protein
VRRAPSVLCVEPSDEGAAELERALGAAGIGLRRALDAETGWRLFTQAPPDAVFTTLSTGRRDAAWLVRRMQEDYLGSLPPVYGLVASDEAAPAGLELDGAIVRPVTGDGLAALLGPAPEEPGTATATRLAELFEVSLLAGDLDAGVEVLTERAARAFRAAECVLDRDDGDGAPAPATRWLRRAADLGTTLIADGQSVVAAPLDVPGGGCLGVLGVIAAGTRRFLAEERHTLRALARRVGLELAWRAAHERLAGDHDRMRQGALLDPLLGILTRPAFEDAIATEIARAAAADLPAAVGVIDVVQLRQINDRHGHEAGDSALAQLADVVRSGLGPNDVMGRVGGDEIGVVLVGPGARDAGAVFDRLAHDAGAAPLYHLDVPLLVKVKIGFTTVGDDRAAGPPLARALAALDRARAGGASVHYLAPVEGTVDSLPPGVVPAAVETGGVVPAGTTLGGMYQILHEINRGAMGVVYRAEDLGLRRPVAVKVLRPDYARDAAIVEKFRNEATMLASVRHEHLVGVYSFGAHGDLVFFVMELVEGESLAELLARLDEAGEPVPLSTIERVVGQVAGALDVLHRAGAVHRDVKPANIVLDRARDRAVLVDVGVATGLRAAERTGEAAGTPGFAAPESLMQGDEGPGTDVYGLAATTYMLLTNLAPFGGGDVQKVLRRQLSESPAPASLLRPGLPPAVDAILTRALAAARKDRHRSAVELAAAVTQALADVRDPSAPTATAAEGNATRGALFRTAYRILGNRLGSAWVRGACERHPGLAHVLRPTLALLGWYPVGAMVELLGQVPPQVRDPHRVARELGRASMTASFARFYGADAATLTARTPEAVLAEAPRFWPWFHRWGRVEAETAAGAAVVTVTGTPRAPLLCCHVEGMLERIAELAGGFGAHARHSACEHAGDRACTFEIGWSTAGPLPP